MTLPARTYGDGGVEMDWPVGVHDLETLAGVPFDQDAYRQVLQFIYIGGDDDNSTLWGTGELWRTQAQIDFLNTTFGHTSVARLQNQSTYMSSLGYPVTFKLYAGVPHHWTAEMRSDTFAFFDGVRYPYSVFVPLVTCP